MAGRRRKRKSSSNRFSKKVVPTILVAVAAFTVTMIVVYVKTGGIPDTLVTAFFACAGGEAGALGLSRSGKAKYDTTNNSDTGGGEPPAG